MRKECGAWLSRRLWGGSNTSPLKTTAWEATPLHAEDQTHPTEEFIENCHETIMGGL